MCIKLKVCANKSENDCVIGLSCHVTADHKIKRMNFYKTSGLKYPGDILHAAKNICDTDLDMHIRTIKYLGNDQSRSALKCHESQI